MVPHEFSMERGQWVFRLPDPPPLAELEEYKILLASQVGGSESGDQACYRLHHGWSNDLAYDTEQAASLCLPRWQRMDILKEDCPLGEWRQDIGRWIGRRKGVKAA